MKVELDIFELSYLLDACLRGSHLRSCTIGKFVDEFFDRLTEQERYNLYEWSLRLTYSCEKEFKPSDASCGADVVFMKRYDPENQYIITTRYEGKTQKHRAFFMEGRYYVKKNRFIDEAYITKVKRFIPNVERSEFELNFKGRRN